MKLLSLKCPRCCGDLEGENNNRVFFCRNCRVGIDFSHSREKEFPLDFAAPAINRPESSRYFAFWLFQAAYPIHSEAQKKIPGRTVHFWVPAFFIKNTSYFGDIGWYYTNRGITPRMENCRKLKLFPADRGEKHAAIYPEIYATRLAAEASQALAEIRILSTRLVWIPFYENKREFIDSILGWSYPFGALI